MSIFLDFDGTITVNDTIGELANFALGVQEQQQQQPPPNPNSNPNSNSNSNSNATLTDSWKALVHAYTADYRAGAAAHHTPAASRLSLAQEVEFLRCLKDVEERSFARVRQCGLFRGISADRFRDAGAALVGAGKVRLRPGFREFVDRRVAEGWRVCVVSVNWSDAFIRGACSGGGSGSGCEPADVVDVIANRVRSEDGAVVGPAGLKGWGRGGRGEDEGEDEGEKTSPVLTNSQDKLDVMRAVLQEESLAGRPSVYVGDSTTDLECLLAAGCGIVMADKPDSTLLETLKRIGTKVPHVRDASNSSNSSSSISWASSFEEINEHVTFDINTR